jgi:hypothetical protein
MAQEVTAPVPPFSATRKPEANRSADYNINSYNLTPYLMASPQLEPESLTWNVLDEFHEPWDFSLNDNYMPWN